MADDFSQQLIQLWDGYLTHRDSVFAPTMTDFMRWVKDNNPNRLSNDARTDVRLKPGERRASYRVSMSDGSVVKADSKSEASVAQGSQYDTLTTEDKVRIRKLYGEGFSLARIRLIIGRNVTLDSISKIGRFGK